MNFRLLIPEGRALPEAVWRARHRGIVILLWAHVAGLAVFAVLAGAAPRHALTESGVVAAMALLAGFDRWGRRFAETMACLGLLTSSALLVHFSGGYIEMHFHFFVMVGLMALYQDWVPFLLPSATWSFITVSSGCSHPNRCSITQPPGGTLGDGPASTGPSSSA